MGTLRRNLLFQNEKLFFDSTSFKSPLGGWGGLYTTNLGQLALAQEKLYTGHYTEARSILAALSTENYIEANDINYYNLYADYLQILTDEDATFTPDDSLALTNMANLCPIEYGASIYKARALFNSIYNLVLAYQDCNVSGEEARFATAQSEISNQSTEHWSIEMFPNPAQNEVTLRSNNENEDLKIVITDVLNRKLLDKRVKINAFVTSMELNLINGAYVVTITNKQNKTIAKKLLIAK
ncbi:MAG: T9SS type A sorting domain-containing protein [Bacteroidetes bacterium]|nr:T9SS type A sorting domain-containing protein [Bacteroidota bacterium]